MQEEIVNNHQESNNIPPASNELDTNQNSQRNIQNKVRYEDTMCDGKDTLVNYNIKHIPNKTLNTEAKAEAYKKSMQNAMNGWLK